MNRNEDDLIRNLLAADLKDMQENQKKEMEIAVNMLAHVTKLFYDACIKEGHDPILARQLVIQFMESSLKK